MVEKKFVIDGMKLSYQGPFDIIDFFKGVEDWISSKGKEKEIKKKMEHVSQKGKKIEWFLEIWEDLNEYTRIIVRLDALFTDVREVKVKKGQKRKTLNTGNVLIILDGIIETEMEGKWQQKPIFYFLRSIADRFIYPFYLHKFEDKLAADVNDLNNTLNDFFDSYKV